jgi:nucleoside-diphosphate-sugar epimerase
MSSGDEEVLPARNQEIGTVLVIGPNGNVGRELIPRLLALGYKVRALQFRSDVTPRDGLEVICGNTLDAESLDRAVAGVDAICHMIRPITGIGDTPSDRWFNGCVAGTRNLLEAARRHPVKRFVNGSADNVFGHVTVQHFGPIDETHPKRFADEHYGLFKILEEEMLRQYFLGFGVPTVVTRFPWIWTDSFAETGAWTLDTKRKVIRLALDRDGRPHVRHDVHVSDAVQGILLALSRDEAIGQDFLFAGPAPYSSARLAEILRRKHGWDVETVPTDRHSWTASSQKAKSVLGYRPRIDLMEWLEAKLFSGSV